MFTSTSAPARAATSAPGSKRPGLIAKALKQHQKPVARPKGY